MNKNLKKILILLSASTLAVFGVMYFYKTIVSPPQKMEFTTKWHFECIKSKPDNLDALHVGYHNDSLYEAIEDMIRLCADEGYIDSVEQNVAMSMFVGKYAPLFIDWCYSRFQKSVWHEKEHTYMKDRIAQLEKMPAAMPFTDSLQDIKTIIRNYEKANKLSTAYNSVQKAKDTINAANNYKQMKYLQNCKALVDKLKEVPKKIEKNHYAYLENCLKDLEDKYNGNTYNDWDSFDQDHTLFSNKVIEYQNNYKIYGNYGRKLDANDSLMIRDKNLWSRACLYFGECGN